MKTSALRSTLEVLGPLALLTCVECATDAAFDCSRLATIRELSFYEGQSDDEGYRYVMSVEKGPREASLARCIDDTTPMDDPRQAPPVGGFVAGDVAVFLLSESTGVPIEEFLPDEVKAEWAQQGVYAYFGYVSAASNRVKLKERWIEYLAAPHYSQPRSLPFDSRLSRRTQVAAPRETTPAGCPRRSAARLIVEHQRTAIARSRRFWSVPAGGPGPDRLGGWAPAGITRARGTSRSQPRDLIAVLVGTAASAVGLRVAIDPPAGARRARSGGVESSRRSGFT